MCSFLLVLHSDNDYSGYWDASIPVSCYIPFMVRIQNDENE